MGDFHELKLEFRRLWKPIVPSNERKTAAQKRESSPTLSFFHTSSTSSPAQLHQSLTNNNNSSTSVAEGIITPGARFCHVGVVYDSSLYIFGGYDGSNRLNDFLRYQFKQNEENLAIPPPSIVRHITHSLSYTLIYSVMLAARSEEIRQQ